VSAARGDDGGGENGLEAEPPDAPPPPPPPREITRSRRSRGLLFVVLGPIVGALGSTLLPTSPAPWALGLLAGAATLLAAGGVLLPRAPKGGTTALALGWSAGLGAVAEPASEAPALVVILGVATLAFWAFGLLEPLDPDGASAPTSSDHASARGAVLALLLGVLLVLVQGVGALGLGFVAAALVAASAATIVAARGRGRLWTALLVAAGVAAASALAREDPSLAAVAWTGALAVTLPSWGPGSGGAAALWNRFVARPARVLVGTFAALAGIATLVLALPGSEAGGRGLPLVDAAFTAVSAACVTGLVVVETSTAFSGFGQAVLLGIIQLGGLGIMGFYAVVFALLGRRLSLREERTISTVLAVDERAGLWPAIRTIFAFTLVLEAAGAALLTAAFRGHGDDVGQAIWRGVFTAVSAFCNAGFALQPTSLVPYADDPLVLHVVAILIVLGGLSPAVALTLPRWARGRRPSTHAALALTVTALLLVVGTVSFLVLEANASLAGMSWADRLHHAWLQSTTFRTAGFHSVPLGETRAATRAVMIAMMFVGGSPGGTAGGVKTTTVAVLALTIIATLRREPRAIAFGRQLTERSIYEAASVVSIGVAFGLVAVLTILATQPIPPEPAFFEVVSALGTVGLTLGATEQLDSFGKWTIMACMFAGRVGPLTLVLWVAGSRARRRARYPEAKVRVG